MGSSILRSTPFRLVLAIGGALVIGLAIAGTIAFLAIRAELLARTDRDVQDTWNVIAQSFIEDDIQDLSDLVASHVRASVGDAQVFLLLDPAGDKIVGNIDTARSAEAWSTLPAAQLGLDGGLGDYRLYSGDVRGYRLVVGTTLRGVDDVGAIVVTALAGAAGGLVAITLLIGLLAGIGGQRRLDAIARTMEQVSRGDLTARIPLSGHNDDIDGLVGSVNVALDRLAALVEGMRQVSVDIAHELKTPLNRLSIALISAMEAAEKDRTVVPSLEEAQQEIRQVTSIFDAMLRIAQIEAGARRARFAPVELAPILDRVGDAYDVVAADAGQSLTVAIAADLATVRGDGDLLTQVVANLVENAIRHCPAGASIAIEGRLERGRPAIIVADTGPGIPDDEKPRVFDRLYRVEKSRTTPGNGLGLSLVKAVVDLHAAAITLGDNHPGLIVTILFPPGDVQR